MRRLRFVAFAGIVGATSIAGLFVGGAMPLARAVDAPAASPASAAGDHDEEAADPLTGKTEEETAKSGTCLADPAVLEDLQAQREKIAREEKDLTAREAEMKAREQAIGDQIKKLEEIRADIAKMENLHKEASEEKVAKIVEMMESMSPKPAAKVFAELDETLAVAAMEKMDTAKLAKIMNNLEPKKSSRLSELLAGVARAKDVAALQAANEPNRTTSSIQSEKGGGKNDGHDQSK